MQLEFNFFIFWACKWDIVPLSFVIICTNVKKKKKKKKKKKIDMKLSLYVYFVLYLTFICSLLFCYYINWKNAEKSNQIIN